MIALAPRRDALCERPRDEPASGVAGIRLPYLLAGLAFACYVGYSLTLHYAFQTTGYDLGIFEQAVRSYAEGRWPTADLEGPGYALLGDHFHPILALLAPLYLLLPRPETLLVAQAALLAVSAIPVTRTAVRAFGTRFGAVLGIGYAASWGLLATVGFDFHEVCFAVPLLAFSLEKLMLRQWTAAVLWALPLVAVKEDLPLTLAAIGGYLCWQGQRRLGAIVAGLGVLTSALLFAVVVPALNNAGHYGHWQNLRDAGFANPDAVSIQASTVLYLLAPTGCLALRSPLLALALPTLGWRFLSGNPAYWSTNYHYSAVLMPIVFLAFVDGLARLDARPPVVRWATTVCAAMTALLFTVHIAQPPKQPQWTDEEIATARSVLARIPDDAGVAASNRLAPQLTGRCRVQLFPPLDPDEPLPDWVVAARPFSWPASAEDQEARLAKLRDTGYDVVADRGTITLLHRR
jgi:uncharacterized membrane protein